MFHPFAFTVGSKLTLVVAVLHVLFFCLEFFVYSAIPMVTKAGKAVAGAKGVGKVEILYANQVGASLTARLCQSSQTASAAGLVIGCIRWAP